MWKGKIKGIIKNIKMRDRQLEKRPSKEKESERPNLPKDSINENINNLFNRSEQHWAKENLENKDQSTLVEKLLRAPDQSTRRALIKKDQQERSAPENRQRPLQDAKKRKRPSLLRTISTALGISAITLGQKNVLPSQQNQQEDLNHSNDLAQAKVLRNQGDSDINDNGGGQPLNFKLASDSLGERDVEGDNKENLPPAWEVGVTKDKFVPPNGEFRRQKENGISHKDSSNKPSKKAELNPELDRTDGVDPPDPPKTLSDAKGIERGGEFELGTKIDTRQQRDRLRNEATRNPQEAQSEPKPSVELSIENGILGLMKFKNPSVPEGAKNKGITAAQLLSMKRKVHKLVGASERPRMTINR